MRAFDTPRPQASSQIRWRVGDFRRTLQVCGLVAVASAAIGLVALMAPPMHGTRPQPLTAADLRTGSLLIVSPDSSLCQERTIDNSTWHIRNGTLVECEDALAKAAGSTVGSGTRLDLIREGFRRH
jgi:hypothetical protein